jgi:hypothetical protein
MGYKRDMINGRGQVKEMKIRLDAAIHRALAREAKKALRSVSKQVAIYIKQGIEAEAARSRPA